VFPPAGAVVFAVWRGTWGFIEKHRYLMKLTAWLPFLRRYLGVSLTGHLAWEVAQLPLYTIFWNETPARIVFAVLHCTTGDIMIAAAALAISLIMLTKVVAPGKRITCFRIAATAMLLGASYTVFSEWANTTRGAWSYSAAMPIVPLLGTGLAPLLQWVLVPAAAFGIAARKRPQECDHFAGSGRRDPGRTSGHGKEADHG